MTAPESQILTLLLLLLVLKFCQVSLYPYLKPALGNISYGMGYPLGVLLLTFVSWYLGIFGIPVQFALLPFAALFAFALYRKRYAKEDFQKYAVYDGIFLAGFLLILVSRLIYPGIIPSGEKFMDAAILSSIMNNVSVPPADSWFGGAAFTMYYYLGHWMFGVLGTLALGESTVVFNLMLPTVFGLAAVSAYSIGCLILDKRSAWLPVLVLLLPNIALFVNAVLGKGLIGSWWDSTRVIGSGATITEYPLFSFLWGDPHAHVLACFNQLAFLCLLLVMFTRWKDLASRGRYLLVLLLSLSLGAMPAMNSWDVLIYAPFYLVTAFLVWRKEENRFSVKTILPFALVPVLSVVSFGQFLYLMMTTGGSSIQGMFFVTTPSPLLEFLGVWGIFLAVLILDGLSVLKKYPWLLLIFAAAFVFGYASLGCALLCLLLVFLRKERHPEHLLAAFGCGILIFLEIFYLKDFMGDAYYRMNTVFKFAFACWFILGTSALLTVGRRLQGRLASVPRKKGVLISAAVYAALILLVAFGGINLGYGGGSLDGSAWLEEHHPYDAEGISWLKENAAYDSVVLEAAGTSYTYSSRVSSMTGLTTVLGWAGHETGWRTGVADVSAVSQDVRRMYENPAVSLSLMEKYGVDYVYVGEVERGQYAVSLPDSLVPVFRNAGVVIYERG